MKITDYIFRFFAWGSLIGTTILIGLVAYWLLWPYTPITFCSDPLPIINKVVSQGEPLQIRYHFKRYTTVKAVMTSHLICNGTYIAFEPITGRIMDKGEHDYVSSTMVIPHHAPVGMCKIKCNFEYEINPLRTINVVVYTEPFEIIKGGP